MTTKKHTPAGALSSTSARTTNQPVKPARPKRTAASDKKGKAAGSKRRLTAEQTAQIEAEAEQFKTEAVAYAKTAYDAALAHYEANHNNPFTLSRLAVVYDETDPRDLHTVVTLPARIRDKAITDADLRKWLSRVEMLCRTLEHPKCSEAFRHAFGAVFTKDILDGSEMTWETPTVVRVLLPLTLLEMSMYTDAAPETFLGIFETLRETLNDEATAEEVRASVIGV